MRLKLSYKDQGQGLGSELVLGLGLVRVSVRAMLGLGSGSGLPISIPITPHKYRRVTDMNAVALQFQAAGTNSSPDAVPDGHMICVSYLRLRSQLATTTKRPGEGKPVEKGPENLFIQH